MLQLPKTAKGLSYLYLLMLFPLMADYFSTNLMKGKVLTFDPWLLLAFVLLVIMFFISWLIEGRKKIFSNHLPYWMITLVLVVLVAEPILAWFSRTSLGMFGFFNLFQKVITWGVFLVIVVLIPCLAFLNRLGKKEKIIAVLMALIYAVYFLVPILIISPRFHSFIYRLGNDISSWFTWMMIFNFVQAYLMHNGLSGKDGGTWFIVTSLGMGLTFFGMKNPIQYESRGWFKTETYVNGIFSGSGLTQLFNINIWVIVGIGLLAFMFFIYLSTKKHEKVN